MSTAQPTQPSQPQYQVSALNLFPVYTTRAAYQQACGAQAPPFDPAQPVKGWADPAPTGQPYLVFDSTAASTGYLNQITVPATLASRVNLPGTYVYPSYVAAPTSATEVGPFGAIGPASPDMICMQADANAVAKTIAPLFPGQSLAVFETMKQGQEMYYYAYPSSEQRRAWAFQVKINGAVTTMFAQQLIEAQNGHGTGAPGHWSLSAAGLTWVNDTAVTTPPANAITLPAAVRPLLPNEQIVHIAGTLFNPAGTFIVERTDMPQLTAPETSDQQLADLKAAVAEMESALAAIQSKLGLS